MRSRRLSVPLLLCSAPGQVRELAGGPVLATAATATELGLHVNDVHSRLNATHVRRVVRPQSLEDLRRVVVDAGRRDESVSVAGGRHAMGGQQFGEDAVL